MTRQQAIDAAVRKSAAKSPYWAKHLNVFEEEYPRFIDGKYAVGESVWLVKSIRAEFRRIMEAA